MSPEHGPNEVIAGVLDALRQSRSLLIDPSPRNIDWCRVAISQCIHKIGGLMQADRSQWNKHELSDAVVQIRGELTAIAKLLDSAAAYRRGMLSALAAENRPLAIDPDPDASQTVPGVHVLA